jgi:hypothetical protein
MKTSVTRAHSAAVLIAFSAMIQGLASGAAAVESNPSWKIKGDLEEACSCNVACPCWFKSVPTHMTCDGAQVVFITSGRYGKTPLDGLAVAQFVQSPEGKSMFESFGHWNFDYVYIDKRATEDQREALRNIADHLFPPSAKTRKFRYVDISRKIEGREHVVTVGNYGSFSGHLIEGGRSGAPKVINPPLADPTHEQFLQGQTTAMRYTDAGQGWKYRNSNYMRNQIRVDDRKYAKFEAEIAEKMAASKAANTR